MLLAEALDRVLDIYRLPTTQTGTEWGGDMADTYTLLQDEIAARFELSRVDEWTVWIMDNTVTPRHGDRLIFDSGVQMEVTRVQPWTSANGTFHHFEMTAKEVFGTRIYADAE